MHTSWNTRDIASLAALRKIESADVINLVSTKSSLEEALETRGMQLLADDVEALRKHTEAALTRAHRNGTTIVSWWDSGYPARLRAIPAPPALLWVQGVLPSNDVPCIGIVGTRSCTAAYGKPVTEGLVDEFVRHGCAVVSGLAAGIDTVAHERTIKRTGVTMAVIASGTDRISPRSAHDLALRIVKHGGAVVSEYRCGQAALPPFFPQRNRIISGLSDAIVVVESAATGGALITAEFALRHNRPLFAVPGSITSSRSIGTHRLIAAGKARILCNAMDVTSAIGIGMILRERAPAPALHDPVQHAIVQALCGGTLHVDAVARSVGIDVGTALVQLLELEIAGYVRQVDGLRFHHTNTV